MYQDDDDALLAAFDAGTLDPATFRHREHLRVAHALLKAGAFTAAADRMARGLKRLVARIGEPAAYHETLTVAFLSLVAEAMDGHADEGFDAFVARCPSLSDRDAVRARYGGARLDGPIARRTFVLP